MVNYNIMFCVYVLTLFNFIYRPIVYKNINNFFFDKLKNKLFYVEQTIII